MEIGSLVGGWVGFLQGVELVSLGVEMGGFMDQGVRRLGLGVEMGGFRDHRVEIDRF